MDSNLVTKVINLMSDYSDDYYGGADAVIAIVLEAAAKVAKDSRFPRTYSDIAAAIQALGDKP